MAAIWRVNQWREDLSVSMGEKNKYKSLKNRKLNEEEIENEQLSKSDNFLKNTCLLEGKLRVEVEKPSSSSEEGTHSSRDV